MARDRVGKIAPVVEPSSRSKRQRKQVNALARYDEDEMQAEIDETAQASGHQEMDVDGLPEWTQRSVPLSSFDYKWQPRLSRRKMKELKNGVENVLVYERGVHMPDLRLLGIAQKFERIGWEDALTFCNNQGKDVYLKHIEQWMSTLKMIPGNNPPFTTQLVGKVGSKDMVMSFETMSRIANFDSRPDDEYTYISHNQFYNQKKIQLDPINMADALFTHKQADGYRRLDMYVEPKYIQNLLMENLVPRLGGKGQVRMWDIRVINSIMNGEPKFSFRQIVMHNVWDSQESQAKKMIPHVRLISLLMKEQGVLPRSPHKIENRVEFFRLDNLSGCDFSYERTAYSHVLKDDKSGRQLVVPRTDMPENVEEDSESERDEGQAEPGRVRSMTRSAEELEIDSAVSTRRPSTHHHWSSYRQATFDLLNRIDIRNQRWQEAQEARAREDRQRQLLTFESLQQEMRGYFRDIYTRWQMPLPDTLIDPGMPTGGDAGGDAGTSGTAGDNAE